MMPNTEIYLSLENDLLARTKKIAAELGIDEAWLIKAAILSQLDKEELEKLKLGKKS
jgi:hypothetical protein